jgi:PTS system nitrogen regulatory IIA component
LAEPAESTVPDLPAIVPQVAGAGADDVLASLARALGSGVAGSSEEMIVRGFREREGVGSTALGGGVALPHCRIEQIETPRVAIARLARGVPFGAPDGEPVWLFVGIVTPSSAPGAHLSLLAALARRLRDPERMERLLASTDDSVLLRELFPEKEAPRP